MDCDKSKELISASIDGELEPEQRRALEQHLSSCSECREFKAGLEEIHNLTANSGVAIMPDSVEERIFAEVAAKSKPESMKHENRSYYRIPKPAVWGAVALIIALIIFAAAPRTTPVAIEQVSPEIKTAGHDLQKVVISESDIVKTVVITNASVKTPKGD